MAVIKLVDKIVNAANNNKINAGLGESHLMFSFLLPPAPNCQNSKTIHYLK